MLKPQVHQPQSIKPLFPLSKPFLHGNYGHAFRPVQSTSTLFKGSPKLRIGSVPRNTIKAIATSTEKSIKVKAVVTVKPTVGGFLSNISLDQGLDDLGDLFGKSLLLELVSAELDPKTGLDKSTIQDYARKIGADGDGNMQYESEFEVPSGFGEIGAILVENEHHKEMYLKDIVLDGLPNGPVNVTCNSWLHSKHDNKQKRVFFTNKLYLPSQTPDGLKRYRAEELTILRGNGQGERKTYDRIYDYDVYNDLGDPDKKPELARPVLGGKQNPYPRRCRTGRPRCDTDQFSEKREGNFYVPRDEAFSEVKQLTFSAKTVYSVLHALVPSLETAFVDPDLGFPYFSAIDALFNEGVNLPPLKQEGFWNTLLPRLVKAIEDTGDNILLFETPETMDRDKFFWFRDEEFSRQTLAGLNPYSIRLITEWPLKSTLDPEIYGPPESAITTELIEKEIGGMISVEELAKAHVLAHDAGYHQLVSHWLRTHCCTEPYVIATNRQLSVMHPIYRLLDPHFRYTMEINGLARQALVNADGIIESSFSPGKYSMEFSSVAYDKQWRFDHEALPKDLISRGLAVEDPSAPHGLKLTIEDYPFANDGLDLWDAIKQWVTDYVNHYYPDKSLVESDEELQAWWTEIRTVGHGDKKHEPWWPVLKTPKDLIEIITTIVWVTSGHHAAVNFGQYTYGGYFPNRPTTARCNIATEDPSDEQWKFFLEKPENALLNTFPSQIQATKVMAILDVLSTHSPDEEYLGKEIEPAWREDPVINAAFEKFRGKLMELEGIIDARNADPKLRNRNGAGMVPYELLKPFSEPGVTGKGVPYSISI
ncbi:Lipoxygenase 2 [Citrus sinensis]|nr:Lipoxygenase 2 [Citrus sinensis]